MSKAIHKPKSLSGYPEWLPEQRSVELSWLDTIRSIFEQYGFANIETPAVEELAVLAAKGETADKELYVLQRLNAEPNEGKEARLGLHYDLTVPLARYVAQHFGDLVFPFKRYQIQKVWRGERPQEGRFREFCQCDIDVVNEDELPLAFDAEMPLIADEVLRRLGSAKWTMYVSNRKILTGALEAMGLSDAAPAIRIIDKLDKIGPEEVARLLTDELSLPSETSERCLQLAAIKTTDSSFMEKARALELSSELFDSGLKELEFVMKELAHLPSDYVVADLSIARGFDYYTGSIFEAKLDEYPDYGSIVAGGRYDDLASSYTKRRLPGVGISIGLSRLFSKMLSEGLLPEGRRSPADVLITWIEEDHRDLVTSTARTLRDRGINVEVYHSASKPKKQLRYAERKNIPYVWFVPDEVNPSHKVKNLLSEEQRETSPEAWTP